MASFLVQRLVRLKLVCTSRASADRNIRQETERSLALLAGLSEEQAGQPVRVPPMRGVDKDMRDWSLYQVLEHNAIVNRPLAMIVPCLAKGQPFTSRIDPKRDVLPSPAPGSKAADEFCKSVEHYFEVTAGLEKLRGRMQHQHPLFGPLNAHGWHVFFGVHLTVHRAQMAAIRRGLNDGARERT